MAVVTADHDDLIAAREAAALLGRTPVALRVAQHKGRPVPPSILIAGRRLYRRRDVLEFARANPSKAKGARD